MQFTRSQFLYQNELLGQIPSFQNLILQQKILIRDWEKGAAKPIGVQIGDAKKEESQEKTIAIVYQSRSRKQTTFLIYPGRRIYQLGSYLVTTEKNWYGDIFNGGYQNATWASSDHQATALHRYTSIPRAEINSKEGHGAPEKIRRGTT